MTKKKTIPPQTQPEAQPDPVPTEDRVEETPYEAVASICSVMVVGLFILTFLGQNYVIPSGSMENTLLVGDHLLVDRITLAPPAKWMPLVHYREPKRGDIVVFIKPVTDDVDGKPDYLTLVKRLVGVPGDRRYSPPGGVSGNGVEPYWKSIGISNSTPDPRGDHRLGSSLGEGGGDGSCRTSQYARFRKGGRTWRAGREPRG